MRVPTNGAQRASSAGRSSWPSSPSRSRWSACRHRQPDPRRSGRGQGRHHRRAGRLEHRRTTSTTPRSTRPRPAPTAPTWSRSTARMRRGHGSRRRPRARTSSSISVTAMATPARTAPSPSTRRTASASTGRPGTATRNTKYWGEYYIRTGIQLAPNAVVILNRLCYASGNSEWGSANPTKAVARQRVDNYGAGFLRAGARAIFADGITNASYVLYGLFRTTRTMARSSRARRLRRGVRLQVLIVTDARLHGLDGARSRRAGTTARSSATWASAPPRSAAADVHADSLLPTTRPGPEPRRGSSLSERPWRTERRPRSGRWSRPGPNGAWSRAYAMATLATTPSMARIVMSDDEERRESDQDVGLEDVDLAGHLDDSFHRAPPNGRASVGRSPAVCRRVPANSADFVLGRPRRRPGPRRGRMTMSAPRRRRN